MLSVRLCSRKGLSHPIVVSCCRRQFSSPAGRPKRKIGRPLVSPSTFWMGKNAKPTIMSERVAEIAARFAAKDVEEGRYIIETRPGTGRLTKKLLDLGAEHIHLYESAAAPGFKKLQAIADEYPGRVTLRSIDLLTVPKAYGVASSKNVELKKELHASTLFEGIPKVGIRDKPRVTLIFSQFYDVSFIRFMIFDWLKKGPFSQLGSIDWLVLIHEEESRKMLPLEEGTRFRTSQHILYRLLFNVELLSKIDQFDGSQRAAHIVRLTPRIGPLMHLNEVGIISEFLFFARQVTARSADLTYLDTLVPNGMRHVLLHTRWQQPDRFDIYPTMKLSQIPPDDFLDIFLALRLHERYKDSAPHLEVENPASRVPRRRD